MKPQIQRKVISNVLKYLEKSDQPISFPLHQFFPYFYPWCPTKPMSKHGNIFCTCLKTQRIKTQQKKP